MDVACATTGMNMRFDRHATKPLRGASFDFYTLTIATMNIPYLSLQKVNRFYLREFRDVIRKVVESGWYLKGEATRQFEEAYAQFVGTRHCVGCGNGLDALTLIFRAYKELGVLAEGDEVIVPANTYIASILSITENGLKPVLVEPRRDTLQLDDSLMEQAITPRTKAVLLVHLYGRCAYTERMGEICEKYHLRLVEDNAQAHGCCFATNDAEKRTGSLGHAAAHSFYPGKNLGALGDAGAVTTDDDELADCVRALGNYGSSRKYVFPYKGLNSRIDELQAAVLLAKLPSLDGNNFSRMCKADYYYRHINNPLVTLPGQEEWLKTEIGVPDRSNVFHIFPILTPYRDELQEYLKERGIGTMIHYPIPPHKQQCYAEWNDLSFPITEEIHRSELSLPCNETLTDREKEYVAKCVNDFAPVI